MDEEDWVDQCRQCKHSYKRKNDDDLMFCRLKKCRFEQYVSKKKKAKKEGDSDGKV